MKRMLKTFSLLSAFMIFSISLFAASLTYTGNDRGPVDVNSVITNTVPFYTQTGQWLYFTSLSTKTVNTPPFQKPDTYTLEFTFYWNGQSVHFSPSELMATGQQIKSFNNGGCAVFLTNNGSGNYSFSIDCIVG